MGLPNDHKAQQRPQGQARFDSTHWSWVARAGSDDASEVRDALESLCSAYWQPIYAEIRRRGQLPADAQDLTQDFFARLLNYDAFERAERARGKFRSYLLGALDHFLADAHRRLHTQKRGGGVALLPITAAEGESWYQSLEHHGVTPAQAFDQNWALLLMDRALDALREEYRSTGREEVFTLAEPFLSADSGADGYAAVCARVGMTAGSFAVAVHRLRRRYRQCVKEQVALTVTAPEDVDAEMKHLFGI